MFLLDDAPVISATDIAAAAACEFATLRTLDGLRGRAERVDQPVDALAQRAGRLGTRHEERLLADYERRLPSRVRTAPAPASRSRADLETAAAATIEALARDDVDVLYQATVFDGGFVGYVDFLMRTPDGWEVQDTKIARSARVAALLQVAAYADLLAAAGVPLGRTMRLVLGDRSESVHAVRDLVPAYRLQRARLERLLREHDAAGVALTWGAPTVRACGRCAVCELEVQAFRDLFLVAGVRPGHRDALRAAGVTTIDALATRRGPVPGVGEGPLASYRAQAQQQLRAEQGEPAFAVQRPEQLGAIPAPDVGDLFFDFEGDPLFADEEQREWNLDYLFGITDREDRYAAFWAHDFAEEAAALRKFLTYAEKRIRHFPGMHIYHYAPYEKAHLLALTQRHGFGEQQVDDLLRRHVLVDLYPIVTRSLRVGSRSYSIKKLEPLYRDGARQGVTNAGDSVEEYARSCVLVAAGETDEAERIRAAIADYNYDDCVSTRQLRDWLLALAADAGVAPGSIAPAAERDAPPAPSPLIEPLLERAAGPGVDRSFALTAAALGYYRREDTATRRAHFERLVQPVEDWVGTTRDCFDVRSGQAHPWSSGSRGGRSRTLRLHGIPSPATVFEPGDALTAVYDGPPLFEREGSDPGARSWTFVTVLDVPGDGELVVQESPIAGAKEWDAVPRALTPGAPIPTRGQLAAVEEFAQSLLDRGVELDDPAADVLRRTPPRTSRGRLSPVFTLDDEPDHVGAITSCLLSLNDSCLAVQGPPGSGKTYVGAHVIRALVEQGWKIGVVAQSHAVVEHLLERAVQAGVPKAHVGKALRKEPPTAAEFLAAQTAYPFTVVRKAKLADFAARQPAGYVIGGTAWDMVSTARVARRQLDLLVIDEAGQFSLANTIAVSRAARNLLLLGDPQQLPQVSQGTHPEPVDTSPLGWIIGEHAVLPPEYGYFLAQTRRMHPALAGAVSDLSYEGELVAHPTTATRHLDGVEPGLHPRPVVHAGDRTASRAEAAEVVRIVRELSARTWTDPVHGRPGPLTDADFIVITPYNAQVACIQQALRAAGHAGVPVGTVDRFQGREAPIAIVSTAASTAADAPRGRGFLLNRNRLNVAVSRAKWAAYLVHSPALLDHLPRTAQAVADLSGFAGLLG